MSTRRYYDSSSESYTCLHTTLVPVVSIKTCGLEKQTASGPVVCTHCTSNLVKPATQKSVVPSKYPSPEQRHLTIWSDSIHNSSSSHKGIQHFVICYSLLATLHLLTDVRVHVDWTWCNSTPNLAYRCRCFYNVHACTAYCKLIIDKQMLCIVPVHDASKGRLCSIYYTVAYQLHIRGQRYENKRMSVRYTEAKYAEQQLAWHAS